MYFSLLRILVNHCCACFGNFQLSIFMEMFMEMFMESINKLMLSKAFVKSMKISCMLLHRSINLIFRELLQSFTTNELIQWKSLCSSYEAELRTTELGIFPKTESGDNNWTQLKNRVVEHVSLVFNFIYYHMRHSFYLVINILLGSAQRTCFARGMGYDKSTLRNLGTYKSKMEQVAIRMRAQNHAL